MAWPEVIFLLLVSALAVTRSTTAGYYHCRICLSNDCCNATILHGAGACRISSISTDVQVAQAPGRPLWFSLGDGVFQGATKSVYASFALLQVATQNAYFQSIQAMAVQSFADDMFFYNTSTPSVCTLRWGCLPCTANYVCARGGTVFTLLVSTTACQQHPHAHITWTDSDGSPGVLDICLGTIPNQVVQTDGSAKPSTSFTAAWALQLGVGVHLGDELVTASCL